MTTREEIQQLEVAVKNLTATGYSFLDRAEEIRKDLAALWARVEAERSTERSIGVHRCRDCDAMIPVGAPCADCATLHRPAPAPRTRGQKWAKRLLSEDAKLCETEHPSRWWGVRKDTVNECRGILASAIDASNAEAAREALPEWEGVKYEFEDIIHKKAQATGSYNHAYAREGAHFLLTLLRARAGLEKTP